MSHIPFKAFGEPDLHVLSSIAQAAGKEIMDVYSQDFAAWGKEDHSPLTNADLRSDAVIRRGLHLAFPGVFILSEESRSTHSCDGDLFFLVDPLDGTKEFIQRNGEFTVNIALVHRGEAVAGVVHAPALGELFFAARGLGAWKEDASGVKPIHVAACGGDKPLRVIASRSHGGEALTAWLSRLPCEYRLAATGSSLKFCRIAEGQADAYPRTGPTCQWDTAAGHAVLQEAGGAVLDTHGQALAYGLGRPILNPNFLAIGDKLLSLPHPG